MKITSNDIGANSSAKQSADSKVIELLNKLAVKPLLIDKLSITKDSGLQLLLQGPTGKLTLQLPARLAEHLRVSVNPSSNSSPSVTLSLNSKNQVVLNLTNALPINKQSSAPPPSLAQQQISPLTQIVFAQAKLVNTNSLKLALPILTIPKDVPLSNQNTQRSNQLSVNQTSPNSSVAAAIQTNLQSSASQLGNAPRLSNNPQSLKVAQISINSINSEQLSSVKINTDSAKPANIETSQVIKNFLRQNFPNKINLAHNLSSINKQVANLQKLVGQSIASTVSSGNSNLLQAANQLITQSNSITQLINQLTSAIKKPNLNTPSNIMQRVLNSGNLFENKLHALSKSDLKLTSSKNSSNSLETNNNSLERNTQVVKDAINLNSTSKTARFNSSASAQQTIQNNTNNLSTSDIKLKLVQIKAQVERMIGQITNLSPKSPSAEQNQSTESLKQAASQVLAEQVRRGLEAPANSLTRGDVLAKSNYSNQINRNLIKGSPLTLSQTNQITRLLSEIVVDVRTALTQIETNQLLSLRTEQPNLHQFLVDLPFAHEGQIDSFELLFEDKDQTSKKSNKSWKVVVKFDLDPLGPMFAQIALKDNRISTDIFAESQPTAKLINKHLHILQKSLFDAGLDIDNIASSQGNIPDELIVNTERSVDIRV